MAGTKAGGKPQQQQTSENTVRIFIQKLVPRVALSVKLEASLQIVN
jgi:hypothetical protein